MINEHNTQTPVAQINTEQRNQAFLIHVLSLVLWILPGTIAVAAGKSDFVKAHGSNAVNFGLAIFAYIFVLLLILPVAGFIGSPLIASFLSMLLVLSVLIFFVTGHIRGAMAGRNGRLYRFPMTLKLLK